MPSTYEILIDAQGVGENKPYTWNFVNQLNELGTGFTITGTPVITYAPADGNLTVGAPLLDTTKTLVQAAVTPAAVGNGSYRMCARASATNGSVTYAVEVRGNLTVTRVQ